MSAGLDELREERDRKQLEAEIASLERERQVSAALAIMAAPERYIQESQGDLVDMRDRFYDVPGFFLQDSERTSRPGDRDDGSNPPFFRTTEELDIIRGMARYLTTTDEISIGVMENLSNYVLDKGMTYRVVPREDSQEAKEVALDASVILESFDDRNDWTALEREMFQRSRRDGDLFPRVSYVGGIFFDLRIIEPEYIRPPASPREASERFGLPEQVWSYGVATTPGDTVRPNGYYISWSDQEQEFVTPDELLHLKVNVDQNVKRGLSDWSAVERELDAATKLLRNMAEGAALQAAIAWTEEMGLGMDQADVKALDTSKLEYSQTRSTAAGRTRTTNWRRFDPGTVLRTEHGRKYHPGPMGAQRNPNFIQAQQAVLRNIGVRWCMPEFMISADTSQANYSSALIAESPFVKCIGVEQARYKRFFSRIRWKVLEMAVEAGVLTGVRNKLELRRAIQIDAQEVPAAVRTRSTETQIRQVLSAEGILSDQTWSELEGLSFQKERGRGAARRTSQGNAKTISVLQGTLPQ
jgi:hypothetical protein